MNTSKVAIVVSQVIEKVEKIAGIGWAVICGLTALILFSEEGASQISTVVVFLVLCALGIVVYLAGRKRGKMRQLFKKYVAELSADPSGSIDNLAAATNTSPDIVKKNLQYMVKKEFFANAFIDEKENRLVLASKAQEAKKTESMENKENKDSSGVKQDDWVICTCSCCGGKIGFRRESRRNVTSAARPFRKIAICRFPLQVSLRRAMARTMGIEARCRRTVPFSCHFWKMPCDLIFKEAYAVTTSWSQSLQD